MERISATKLKDLRDEIGIVQQDVPVCGTIIDNIRYGRPMRPTRSHPRSESGQCNMNLS